MIKNRLNRFEWLSLFILVDMLRLTQLYIFALRQMRYVYLANSI